MDGHDWLAQRFEEHRGHLRAVAYRMLGSTSEAEDAVQEAWLRLSRSDTSDVANLGGWLTTVVGRVCLDMLRSRRSRREELVGAHLPESTADDGAAPEDEAVLAQSVGVAMLVVLDTLDPAERIAFVLHDMFAVPFDEIAPVVSRTPAAARQLASRARRRVQRADAAPDADPARRREVVDAFLAAARGGDFEALLSVLAPDVVLRADDVAVRAAQADPSHAAPPLSKLLRGASAVANTFKGRAQGARPALVDGAIGAAWAPDGRPRSVFDFTIVDGRITAIEVFADPDALAQLEVEILDA
ncbi:RNA polymerase sigma factor [Saccharopolyspora subtropica]|uniref:RNA polymerase sigma factor n=1 Tax=Saccharopolyspora thermophila TaxID=89367 RepID=A0A917NB01_9PSEU|nr:sigma-70 family RNA polymerase sigma factor [Saccharopolyspora subtropica]GGI84552.1 RNA polymerase sigma factor [Saccharopolyspora subtropica]